MKVYPCSNSKKNKKRRRRVYSVGSIIMLFKMYIWKRWNLFSLYKLKNFFWKGRETEGKKEGERQIERSHICWLIPQMPRAARIGQDRSWEPGNLIQISQVDGRVARTWAITYCLTVSTMTGSLSQDLNLRSDTGCGCFNQHLKH